MKRETLWMRTMVAFLVLTFSTSQAVWAVDVRQMLIDAKTFFDEQDAQRPHGMTSEDLAAAEAQQQAVFEQQQFLQDFQNTTFNLTTAGGDVLTYVGNKLDSVERPDGTQLNNVLTDAAGNIQEADLLLADGSIQVYQNGQVLGYMTPDGSQVFYSGGEVSKVIDKNGVETLYTYTKNAQGAVTETTLNNPAYLTKYDANGKIKEAIRKSDNQKIFYTTGMIQRIENPNGSQVLFTSQLTGGDTVLTPQGGSGAASNIVIDANGNKYYFTAGQVSKIELTDGSKLESIAWDAAGKVDDGTLTETDGSRHIYQAKKLTRSYDLSNVVTNYTYNPTTVVAVKAGDTWEYLTDGTPVKATNLLGDVTTYLQSGPYKGFRDKDSLASGQVFVYEYSGTGSSIVVQKRELHLSMYNTTTFDGQSNLAQSGNPGVKTLIQFPVENYTTPSVVLSAVNGTAKNLTLNLTSGSGSTYTWNGTTASLGVTLNKGIDYQVELKWETGRIGVYVYTAAVPKPSTPTVSIADRAWDPKFKVVATNVRAVLDATSSGYFNRNTSAREKNYSSLGGSPVYLFEFRPSSSSRTVLLRSKNWTSTGLMRTYEYYYSGGSWRVTRVDQTSTSGATTTVFNSTFAQTLSTGTDYVAELRLEGGKMNFYVYAKGQARPAPTTSLDSYSFGTLEVYTYNAPGQAVMQKNLSAPTAQSVTSAPLTSRMSTLISGAFLKPAAPAATVAATDFSSIRYDSAFALKEVLMKDGLRLVFEQGMLKAAYGADGALTTFQFTQSGLQNIIGSSIVQNSLTSTYDAEGKLSSVALDGMTVHYEAGGQSVEWIERTDGTELWDLTFDAAGNLQDALIIAPDGEERVYAAGKLTELRHPDHNQLFYANDKVTQMVTPENLTYNFTYSATKIEAVVLQGTVVPDVLTPVLMEYDLNFNLKKVVRQNQEVLNYLNTDLMQIDAPSSAPKVFSYTKDAGGAVLSYTVTRGNVVTTYDANGQPTRSVINPDAGNTHTFDISYQYGKMREVKKDGAVTLKYSYSFDASGKEFAQVEDLAGNATKLYDGENIVSSLDKATNVLSFYEYADGKVVRVQVSRFGRTLHIYDYSYDGSNTVVADEVGVVRTYDADQKLIFLERNGEKFAYTYDTVQVETGQTSPQPQESLLPVGIFDWTGMSTIPYSSQSWNFWGGSEKYLVTYWDDQWIEYKPVLAAAGDLVVRFEGSNSGGLPTNYANFDLAISVDGVSKGVYRLPASTAWQPGEIVITGLSAGQHTFRMTWTNEVWQDSTHDANFVYRNFSMSSRTLPPPQPVTQPREIVTETLVEKRTADGSLIHYTGGRMSRIDYADGRILKDFVEDEEGGLKEVRFQANSQDTIGTKIEFVSGEMSKATFSNGDELIYSYDKAADGRVTNTWVKKGAAHLKYDTQGDLVGLRIDGVMAPDELLAVTTHNYTGGNGGSLGYDGNPLTAHTGAFGGGTGSSYTYLTAEHTFPEANAITQFSYRLDTSSYSSGSTDNGSSAFIYLETKDATTGLWKTVAGTYAAQSHSNAGGGGSTASAKTPGTGLLTLNVNIPNVLAVRAHARSAAYSNGGGNHGGQAFIYEVQFNLADESSLTYSATTATGNQAGGYSFSGYVGGIAFDAVGSLTQSDPDLTTIQQELVGVVQNFIDAPYFDESALVMLLDASGSETVVLQEFSEDGTLETQTKGDGTVTLFDNNKPLKVLDQKGRVLIEYSYDASGNPSRVYLKNARDTLPDEVVKAKLEIQTQRAASLRNLAAQKNLAYQSIQTQFQNARILLDAQLASQQGLYDNMTSSEAKGSAAKSAKADALGQIDGNIELLETQLTVLYDQEADAYANLDTQVKALSDQIEADSSAAVTNLGIQESNMKREILRQEVSPIVYDYYRRILGRDPDKTEYDSWISQIDYNSGSSIAEVKTSGGINLSSALASSINSMPELSERQTYVAAIKNAVTAEINSYLSMTQTQKETYAAALGLTPQDLIPLTQADATAILSWINSRSLHFGQSASLALESLLDQKGKTYVRTDLARQAILIDVLTGVISPLDDGDLVISVFALNKVAGLYGVSLQGTNLSWDDLKAIVPTTSTTSSPRAIAHINGNHYVIVTAMTADSITYIDPGVGKDKQNESITVTKAGFLKVWQGNVTLNQVDFNSIKTIRGTATQAKVLSAMEAKNIRGAFWGSLLGLIGSVLSWVPGLNGIGLVLTAISAAVSAIEEDWISAISSLVTLGIGSFGDVLKNAFDGVVTAMGPLGQVFSAAGQIIGGAYKAVTGLAGDISKSLGGFIQAIGIGSDLAVSIAQIAVSQGLRVGVSKGFEAVGVNPQMAGFLGSLTSGAVMGAITPQTQNMSGQIVSRTDMIRTGIQQAVTIAQVGNFGIQMGLDAGFANVLGMALGAIQGTFIANPTTDLQKAFNFVKPKIGGALANYSLQKVGESIGLNPFVSTAIAAPISSAFAQTLSTTSWQGQVPTNASLNVSISNEKMVYENTGSAIAMPVAGTAARSWWDSTMSFLQSNLPNMINSAIDAYYLAQGRPNLPGITPNQPTTTETPVPQGATIVMYQDVLTGESKEGFQINSSTNSYIVYDRATGKPVKRVSNNTVEEGKFEYVAVLKADGSVNIDFRKPAYISEGKIKYTTEQAGQARFTVHEKQVNEIYIDVNAPDIVLSPGTVKDASNKVISGAVKILALGLELTVANGAPKRSDGNSQGSEELTKRMKRVFVFGNGFENERRAEDSPDPLIESYITNLQNEGIVNPAKKLMIYLYEMTRVVFNAVDWLTDFEPDDASALFHILESPIGPIVDVIGLLGSILSTPLMPEVVRTAIQDMRDYLAISWGIGNDLVQETISELDQKGPIEDGIAFVHSGATAPLLEALRIKPYDIQTVIVYEGPHHDYNANLLNPNLERVIHVRGTGTVADGDDLVPFLDWAKFNNTANPLFENINIQITGAFHSDYSYNEAEWDAKIAAVVGSTPQAVEVDRNRLIAQKERNRRVNIFMRRLYQVALSDQSTPGDLKLFLLTTPGVIYDQSTNFATVNLNDLILPGI